MCDCEAHMKNIVRKLTGGDRRSIGRANEVAKEIARDRSAFARVFAAMLDPDPVVRMRAADALEKASALNPGALQPFKRRLLAKLPSIDQQEVRWHVAQMLPRLRLTPQERDHAISLLLDYLNDKSSIVKTSAMQALADFALQDKQLRLRVRPILENLTAVGTPAMRARGRKLLKCLQP